MSENITIKIGARREMCFRCAFVFPSQKAIDFYCHLFADKNGWIRLKQRNDKPIRCKECAKAEDATIYAAWKEKCK
jgi:hypothetical protein